jgi:hypothetical protein
MLCALRVGVPSGIAGGAVMAMWSMVAMWVTGLGFWTPLNLIAHTFYRSAPLNASFSAPALLIGLAVHMTVASFFGTAIAVTAAGIASIGVADEGSKRGRPAAGSPLPQPEPPRGSLFQPARDRERR